MFLESVINFYRDGGHTKQERMACAMRMLILIPEFVGGIVGVLAFIDFGGVFMIFDFYTARTLLNSRAAVVAISDIVLVFYCHDIYNTFKSGRRFRRHTPFLVQYWWALPAVIVFGVAAVAVDFTISYLGVRGELGGNVILIPVAYLFVLYAITTVWLLVLGSKVTFEVKRKLRTTSLAGLSEAGLGETIERTLLMRKYMLISSIGRIFNLISFVLLGLGVHLTHPVVYVVVLVCFVSIPSLVSSTAQIFLAIEVTPSTRTIGRAPSAAGATPVRSPSAVVPMVVPRTCGINPVTGTAGSTAPRESTATTEAAGTVDGAEVPVATSTRHIPTSTTLRAMKKHSIVPM